MKKTCLYLLVLIIITSCSRTYYIVRHAEKAAPDASIGSDVPLSDAGRVRAIALRDALKSKKIRSIYSTNTIRTRTTVEPLSVELGIPIQTYGPIPDSAFLRKLQQSRGNSLIVGHSNTVDDIVNMLSGEKKISDLNDNAYNNLFVVKLNGNGKVVRVQ
ncbi:MAG TPA: phosphoglycerate mutase family protein, partial [Flavitalea sp.]|nr:phosphoglycerate mutase family protein [Flavitalea sp.]